MLDLDESGIETAEGVYGRTANAFRVPSPTEKRWRIKSTIFTCVHPAEHIPAAHLVEEIRVFLPKFVPVWCIQEWEMPSGEEVAYGFHVLCQWHDVAQDPSQARPIRVTNFPPNFPFTGGYIYELRTWGMSFHPEIPWLFYPFSEHTVEWIRQLWNFLNAPGTLAQKYFEMAEEAETKQARMLEAVDAEAKHALLDEKYVIARFLEEGKLYPEPEPTHPSIDLHADKPFASPSSAPSDATKGTV